MPRLRPLLLAASLAILSALPALAQSPANTASSLPRFDVASIKPADPTRPVGLFTYPGGRIVCSNCPLQYLFMEAFNLPSRQIVDGPERTGISGGDAFDIEARPPATSDSIHSNPASFKSPPNPEQRLMLQALLIDRFHLKFHRGTIDGPVYLLERGSKPLKLLTPKDKEAFPWAIGTDSNNTLIGPNGPGFSGVNITMAGLAARLTASMGRPVVDRTGIEGSYDFDYLIGYEPGSDLHAAIIDSLHQIGLKLTPGKAPIDTIVIDSAAKPTPN